MFFDSPLEKTCVAVIVSHNVYGCPTTNAQPVLPTIREADTIGSLGGVCVIVSGVCAIARHEPASMNEANNTAVANSDFNRYNMKRTPDF